MNKVFAYAYFMVQFDENERTLLDTLNSLVLQSLSDQRLAADTMAVQNQISVNWGIEIPLKVIRHSLSVLIARGDVVRSINRSDQVETFKSSATIATRERISSSKAIARAKYELLIGRIALVINDLDLASKYDARYVLEQYLDESSLGLLTNNLKVDGLEIEEGRINRIVAIAMGVGMKRDEEFIEALTDIAIGDAVYRGIKDLTESDVDEQTDPAHVRKLDLYLDTGIISRILGYFGEEQEKASNEFIEMAKKLGYSICAFEHTIEELDAVIRSAAYHMHASNPEMHGPMVNYAIRKRIGASGIIQEAIRLRDNCKRFGIALREAPPIQQDTTIALDYIKLMSTVCAVVKHENPIARDRDVKSLNAIYILRNGEAKKTIDSSDALFITHNRSLQKASHKFFKEHFSSEGKRNIVQLCMTDIVFAARMWVKIPTLTKVVPREQIISNTLANLHPSRKLKGAFLQKLHELNERGLISDKDALITEYSSFTDAVLATNYDYNDIITRDNDVISTVNTVVCEMREEFEAARQEGRSETFDEMIARITELEEQLSESETELLSKNSDLEKLRDDIRVESLALNKAKAGATRISRYIIMITCILVFSIIAFTSIVGAIDTNPVYKLAAAAFSFIIGALEPDRKLS